MLTDQQLEMRKTGISASEIAAVCGLSPWETPMKVYARKVEGAPDEETNAMRFGSYVEAAVADWYRDSTGAILQRAGTRRSRRRPWMLATPDRYVMGIADAGRLGPAGVRLRPAKLLEIKSVGYKTQDMWSEDPDGIPDMVRAQVNWQLDVCRLNFADVAVVFLATREFRVYKNVPRTPALVDAMVDIGGKFWHQHVVPRVAPPVDGSEAALEYLRAKYPLRRPELLPAPPGAEALAREYAEASLTIKLADEAKELAKQRLCEIIGAAAGIQGEWGRATWKPDSIGKVNWKGLAESLAPSAETIEKFRVPPERKFLCRLKGEK